MELVLLAALANQSHSLALDSMKKFLIIVFVMSCVSAFAGDVYRIRFMDLATKKPIVRTPVTFVPRVMIEKSADSERWGLNAKFLRKISTDHRGDILLKKAELEELTHEGAVTCDGEPDDYSTFAVGRSPIKRLKPNQPASFHISYFTSKGRVRGLVYLNKDDINHVWLDKTK